ncbi:hypothetical protein CcI49_00580 [Frankia sp. CcI49]|uniref:Crp/Fnr family transcriptional regulator n=1 Tax=unclassified Frankia TaxID=2632575 RepID=UPI0006CA2AAD|nr:MULTISPECIES: Crp/Fnr family transcriptional regulator [unclassified Frankia]ONH62588.1 hypothetical protein CcI49_00580 [Frankia sp. CcI49]
MADLDSAEWSSGTLLAQLSPVARARVVQLGVPRTYQPDEVLLAEGERTTHMILLLGGFVRVTKRGFEGRSSLIDMRGAGDTIGELAAKDGLPRSATVTAAERVWARQFSREAYFGLRRDVDFMTALDATDGHRNRYHGRRALDSKEAEPTRFARVLAELAVTYGIRDGRGCVLPPPFVVADLAELSGMSRPAAQRILRDLELRRLVELDDPQLRVPHLGRLGEVAYPGQEIPVW